MGQCKAMSTGWRKRGGGMNKQSDSVGEPVAWMWLFNGEVWDLSSVKDRYTAMSPSHVQVPLYTTPQQRTWVGLTDIEINDLVHSHDDFDGLWEFADAVEAKLKEKNT